MVIVSSVTTAHQAAGLVSGRGGLWSLPALVVAPSDPRADKLGWEAWQDLQALQGEVRKTVQASRGR